MELELLKWLVLSLIGVGVYFLKRTVEQMDKQMVEQKAAHNVMQMDIQNIRNEYLHKNDFREFKAELRLMFEDLKSDIRNLKD